jgi:hypothetical protein
MRQNSDKQDVDLSNASGRPGFGFRQGKDFFFATMSKPYLGSTRPPVQWVPAPPRVKQTEYEADNSPSGVEFKNAWIFTSIHPDSYSDLFELGIHKPVRTAAVLEGSVSSPQKEDDSRLKIVLY